MRLCKKGFIQTYLDYTQEQESPEFFHLWSAISVIGAALGRKCYVDRGFFQCYPNTYIILVSESARCRKTVASGIAVGLYRSSGLPGLFKGKITTRGLTKHLSDTAIKTGGSHCFIYSPELGKVLGADSYTTGLMVALTDYYDCPAEDTILTATQGSDNPKDVFLSLLGCTIPQWLSTVPGDMVEGGFSSRTLFIVQNTPRKPMARKTISMEETELKQQLVADLTDIGQITGEFSWTEDAEVSFDMWYNQNFNFIDEKDLRLRPYFARKGEHLIKVAMALSAGRSSNRRIEGGDIRGALSLLTGNEVGMATAFRGVSLSDSTKHQDKILSQIEDLGGKAAFPALMRRNRFHMDHEELRKVLQTLQEGNIVRREFNTSGEWYIIIE